VDFGGNKMKHFILFLAAVFTLLFIAHINKNQSFLIRDQKPTVKIFTYSSFSSKWGPGPVLQEMFEKTCDCHLEYLDGSDSGILLQRLKIEGEKLGADLVIGLDQYDLQKAVVESNWRSLDFSSLDIDPQVKSALKNEYFVPYDWGVLTFIGKNKVGEKPASQALSLDQLLTPQYAQRIAMQDPRTSSVGLQFVMWILKTKGEEEGFKYISQMMRHAHSFSPSWSTSYGLFKAGQADLVFSYTTSPLYNLIEEKNPNFKALEMVEPNPVQVEFVGIPTSCRSCDIAEKFLNLMLSVEGQKVIMQKNYMLPVFKSAAEGTPFEKVPVPFRLMDIQYPSVTEVDRILKHWSDLRRESSL
jgi:thiamine transport system substrate-binding protein